jgi:hypothetical protein
VSDDRGSWFAQLQARKAARAAGEVNPDPNDADEEDDALDEIRPGRLFVLGANGDKAMIGLMLSGCVAADGSIAEWAMDLLATMGSYAECVGETDIQCAASLPVTDLPLARRLFGITEEAPDQSRCKAFGNGAHPATARLFLGSHHFVVTGRRWHGAPDNVGVLSRSRFARLAALLAEPATEPQPTVTVTFFPNSAAKTKREETLTLAKLAALIKRAHAAQKEDLPWLKLARFGEQRSDKNSLRHDANVLAITGIEADYDRKEMSLAEANDRMARAGLTGILYPSPSYTPEAPKWRVLCPFSQEYPPEMRDRFMARLNGLFGGFFDRVSWVISQSYYFGRVANPDHHATVFEGTCIDKRDDLDAGAIGLPKERGVGRTAHPKSRPEDITEARLRGLIQALLDNIRTVPDGESHFTLRDNCLTLGGYLHLTGWSVEEAAEQAVAALPSADDWDQARETALWAIRRGMERPLDLEDRPNPHQGRGDGAPAPDAEPPPECEAEHPPASPDPQPWPEPVDCFTAYDATPVDVTTDEAPPALRPFVEDTAERMGVATSSVTLGALVSCSAVISDEWRLQPKRHDYTWTENARLWGAIVGPPSILKTPVIKACTEPIDRLETKAHEQWKEDMARYEILHEEWKAAGDKSAPEPHKPKMPRFIVESTTVEALQEVLRDDEGARFIAQAKKVLSRQDELSEWIANLDRYNSGRSGGDRGAYLKLYNGGRFSVDRIGRGSFSSNNWSACLLGGIQPEPIQRIAKQSVDDGLLQRFTYDVPQPHPRDGTDRLPNRAALDRYDQLIRALAALHPKSDDEHRPSAVVLHANAHVYRENIDDLAQGIAAMPDTTPGLRSALGKWSGLFGRICLTFHLIDVADARAHGDIGPPLDVVPTATAARVARYMRRVLLPHLFSANALMFATVQTNHARWIAGHILAHTLDRITARDVVRAYIQLQAPEDRPVLDATMAGLVTIGWLDPEPARNLLNPVAAWRVNPTVHQRFAARAAQERSERRQRAEDIIRRRREFPDTSTTDDNGCQ